MLTEDNRFSDAADAAIERYGEALKGVMIAGQAKDATNAEIERTLGGCVCGPMLVLLAKEMRERGLLKWTLRDALPAAWVDLIYEAECCKRPGLDLLLWNYWETVCQVIILTTRQADALAELWPEQADRVRDVACERIGMLAWG